MVRSDAFFTRQGQLVAVAVFEPTAGDKRGDGSSRCRRGIDHGRSASDSLFCRREVSHHDQHPK